MTLEDPRSPRVKAAEDTILELHYEIERLKAEIVTLRNFMTGIHTTAHLALYSAHPKGTDHDHG